jgi:carbon monoxide dehydrogenase subunit G
MEMQGSRALAITQQQAWDALNNPEVLKVCIPGCDKVEATGDNQYAVGVAVKDRPRVGQVWRQDHAERHQPAQQLHHHL